MEILKDGAAATYGSDAIGAVANFITRKNFSGLELQADYRYVRGGDGDYTGSALYGWVGDTANLLISAGYQHRSEISNIERDWIIQPYLTNPQGYSGFGNPGTYLVKAGPAGSGATLSGTAAVPRVADANCAAVGGHAGFTGLSPACYFTYVPFDNLVEKQDQYQLYGEFNSDVGETGKFHAEALYSQTNIPDIRFSPGYPPTTGPTGPGGAYTIAASNPGFNTFLTQTGQAALIGVAQSAVTVGWRPFANGGNNSTGGLGGQSGSRKYEELHLAAGLKGELGIGGINYDVGVTYIAEWQDQQTTDVLIDRLQNAMNGLGGAACTGTTPGANGCQYFNPFSNAYPGNPALGLTNPGYVPANANDKALVAWLFDRQKYKAQQNTFIVDAVLSGQAPISLPGGDIGWAVGMQYRKLTFLQQINSPFYDARITPCPVVGSNTCAVKTGPYIFLGQNIPLDLEQSVYAAFGELSIPLTDTISGQLSLRYEDYGGQTGSTTNPQFRVKWQALDWFALRASIGSSFRGPTATNVANTGSTSLAGLAAAGNNFKSVDNFGNPATGPESANTYSVGAIVQTDSLTATVDYWSYKLQDQIVQVPAAIVATAVAGTGNGSQLANCSSALRYLITFSNNNTCIQGTTVGNDISRVRSDFTNGPTIETTGIDADVTYRFSDVMGGGLELGANASYVMTYKQDAFVFGGITVSPAYSAVGYTNYDRLPGTIPRWRGQFYADYNRGDHNLRWTINFVDGVTDNRGPTTVQTGPSSNCNVANATAGTATNCQLTTQGLNVDSFMSHDLTYRWQLPSDLTLTASVLNALDQDPSLARLELTYDPFIGNPLGRTIKVGVKKKF